MPAYRGRPRYLLTPIAVGIGWSRKVRVPTVACGTHYINQSPSYSTTTKKNLVSPSGLGLYDTRGRLRA